MPEKRSSTQDLHGANIPTGLLVRLRRFWRAWSQAATRGRIRFQKYRVAPRLGTNTVRQRLLLGLHAHAGLTATETGLA